MMSTAFRITGKKGFHVTFANGWTVSVQFGPGNYCDNYDLQIGYEDQKAGERGSMTAECAVWPESGGLVCPPGFGWGDTVSSRSTPEEVLKLFNWASTQSADAMLAARARGKE